MSRSPSAESSGAACAVNERNEHTELNEEDKNTCVIGNSCYKSVARDRIKRTCEVKVGIKERTGNDTDKERAVNFLCNERKADGDYSRKNSPDGSANFAFAAARFANERAESFAVGAVNGCVGATRYSGNYKERNDDNRRHSEGDLFCFCHDNFSKILL